MPTDRQMIPVSAAVRHSFRPAERIRVSEWADRYRILTKESGAAEPGPWRTSRIPYAKEIMDAFCDPMIREIDIIKSARVGMTECGNNMLAYAIDQDPGPCMYVYPDESAAKDECKNRLQPMIEQSPRLREHIPHAGWATQVDMNLRNSRIAMAWASSATTLIRRTFRYVFIDEIDNCQRQAGALGEIIELAKKRMLTYGQRAKLVVYTSPTVVGAPAWSRWEACPDRRRYYVPCPLCGAYQVLAFDRIKIPPSERDPERIEFDSLARYQCIDCQGQIAYDAERGQKWMVARGLWISGNSSAVCGSAGAKMLK
ncbi:MAG: phage terminase large subunit family protein [Planctomycetota bacterium]